MNNHDILRMAIILGADASGFDKDIGTIEAGKLAVILVLDADTLVNLRNTAWLRYVVKNWRVYDANTLVRWRRARALPNQDWRNLQPAGVRARIR